ncbi:MAG TPA: hypothetical protein VGH43_18735 [Jatrophihabitans sp.]
MRYVDSLADLRAKLIQSAESVRKIQEKIAATLDALALNGDSKHTKRRQALADQARINAEVETTDIDAILRGLDQEIAFLTLSTDTTGRGRPALPRSRHTVAPALAVDGTS